MDLASPLLSFHTDQSDVAPPATPIKGAGGSVRRAALGALEANTMQPLHHQQQQQSAHCATPSRPEPNANGAQQQQPKPSPGQLRAFFELISPEMKRIRSMDGGQQLATGNGEVDASQLECDETLGPIPMGLFDEQPLGSSPDALQMSDASADHTMQDVPPMLPSSDLMPLPSQSPPMKSPMSTLLSAVVKPGGLPTPRGLSFTFGDLRSPLTVTQYQPTNAQPALPAPAPAAGRQLSRARSESRSSSALSPLPSQSPSASSSSDSPQLHGRFTCSECSKPFPSNSALSMHLLVHSGEKPFACPFKGCAKRFRQKGHLVSHYRKHTGEKPFACPGAGCTKRFKDKSGLNTHVKRQHPGVSAVLVTASTPLDSDESAMTPELEAAIANANVTLQALQNSTMAAHGQQSGSGNRCSSVVPAKKRTHSAMDRLTPGVGGSATPAPMSRTLDSPSFAPSAPQNMLMHDDDADEKGEIECLTHEVDAPASVPSAINTDDMGSQSRKKSRGDSLSPAATTPRFLANQMHMPTSLLHHHDRAMSGSGSFSPLTAPSPISFSSHLSMRDHHSHGHSRSGHSTPTNGLGSMFGASSWMPQVPLPAPVTVANALFASHMGGASAASAAHAGNFAFLPPVHAHAPATTAITASSTSAFSFKATPTLAMAVAKADESL